MKLLYKLIAIAFVLCCTRPLQAQQPIYQFRHLDYSHGLSHNQVTTIYKDSRGFMWFGTMSGLNRYDGYVVKTFHHSIKDSNSLSDDYIAKIAGGPYKKLWIQLRTGFNIYDPVTEKFERRADKSLQQLGLPGAGLTDIVQAGAGYWFVFRDSGLYYYEHNKPVVALLRNRSLQPFTIADVKTDAGNNIWVVYSNALIEKIDGASKKVVERIPLLQQKGNPKENLYHLFIDSQNDCWIYAGGGFNGAYRVHVKNNTVEHIAKDEGTAILSSNIIMSMAEDNKGLLWIATDHGGLNILDKRNMRVQVVLNKEGDDKSLTQNSLTEIYKDDFGIMWVGTFKQGINYYQEGISKFPLYTHQGSDASGLPFNDVNRFAEDAKGNIWIGTNGGGLIYFNRAQNTFKQFRHDPANNNSLCNDVIVSLCVDHNNLLWIGTYYGGLDSYDGKTFKHYRHNDKDSNSLADDRVWEIYEDRSNNLWIGNFEEGLERFDPLAQKFIHYKPGAPNAVHSGHITSITEDRQGNLWVGTSYGIDVKFRGSPSFKQLLSTGTGLSNDNVNSVFQDSRGSIWVGTRDGLNIYNARNNSFQVFRKEDGLPDNTILDIVEDNAQHLWISTPNGISRVTYQQLPGKGYGINCLNYDRLDGLQEKQFNQNAVLKTSSGELIFGGAKGFNLFNPDQLKINIYPPTVVLTGLQVFNEEITADEKIGNHVVLEKAIAETNEIRLKYDQNIFSLEFAALNYINSRKNKYAYRLQGFNNNWLYSDGSMRKVTYTNLDPGKYTFYVKASNEDGIWNEKGIAVNIVILPPFWKTRLAWFVYVLFVVCILIIARRMIIQRARTRFALELERKEAQRMHEVDVMKIRFLTNMSHEFRTPLSLIITPLERIIRSATEPSLQSQYQLIHRNARRLLNLVNQLLDFRKMEVHELKLHPAEGDIVHFLRETCYSFTDIAEKKQIRFSYNGPSESMVTHFDHDKLERILFNLLSNAFKFTAENGEVAVEATIVKNAVGALLEIKIKDSGIGIPAERQEKIFERFFQHDVPGTMINQGSGIGLAITKEFVNLFNGTISVESREYKGACFTVQLPLKEYTSPVTITGESTFRQAVETATLHQASRRKKFTILLVEDSEDFLFYLKDNLGEYYNIITAVNGKEGWQKTLSAHPDIIVSDIIMPGTTGIELCHKIKSDRRTKHIPVILLTALTGEEQQLRSIETGAADYLTKPFNFEILLSKIKNLLLQQQSMRKTFTKKVEVKNVDIAVKDERSDEMFVQNATTIIEKNMSNPDFSVEDLSRALLMSRSAVYKKMFVLTGKTPIEYIRTIRLERAALLLLKTNKTVAEVAYETGFNNPKYFSRYFKNQFGVLPSTYHDTANFPGKDDNEDE
ncbi:response regulator [Niastella caeni]|uniref:histidine kinase n=1 Tax=Niastella caeni TaxID=2569763 RepID=A0A4S8HY03_9BACT|nr:two-component regulator propeller domain-containing protein [Niastella caeni]THU40191.1 response regulator [Niastella caeni]